MRTRRAFSLLELMVTVAIIAIIISLLVPAFSRVRQTAVVTRDLTQIRGLQLAQSAYALDNDYALIDVGLEHGGLPDEDAAWINTLQPYYDNNLVVKSPLDISPHWPLEEGGDGVPIPGQSETLFRRTSYGVNNYLTKYFPEDPNDPNDDRGYRRLSQIKAPASTIQFLHMVNGCEGDTCFAGADHVHVENWNHPVPEARAQIASTQMQINAASGELGEMTAESNYGFLDGHVETLSFSAVYQSLEANRFDPKRAATFSLRAP